MKEFFEIREIWLRELGIVGLKFDAESETFII